MKHIPAGQSKIKKIPPFYWALFSVAVLVADYLTGPFIQFPVFYIFPVYLAAWYRGRPWALVFAAVMPLARFYYNIFWRVPWTVYEATVNVLIQIFVLALLAVLTDRVAMRERTLQKEVHLLEGLLPICSNCKKIRNDKKVWEPMEKYIGERSEASFTHGICPECMAKLYPQFGGAQDSTV